MATITFSGMNIKSSLPTDVVNQSNLQAGIRAFLEQGFDADFHNSMYRRFHIAERDGRLTWHALVDELAQWKALRSGVPGRDRFWYYDRGREYFPKIRSELTTLRTINGGRDLDLSTADPDQLVPLFDLAKAVKGADSPMFASKLCHFLIPSAYPITDNTMLGDWGSDYWTYWRRCAEGWKAADQEVLKAELRKHTPGDPVPYYPWGSKIGELCHIGAARRSK